MARISLLFLCPLNVAIPPLHVHDLVNKDSNGKLRVQAFLEHKRAQDRQQ